LQLSVSDVGRRIFIGPSEPSSRDGWADVESANADTWWFVDAIACLRAAGCGVVARHNGAEWTIEVTWSGQTTGER
jgi:hypothetical protein